MPRRHTIFLLSLVMPLPVLQADSVVPAVHSEYNATLEAQMPLEEGWKNPPRLARTRVWWWWLNGHTDRETITRDLEAMKAAGMGGANVIDAGGDTQEGNRRVPHGPDFGSPEWRALFTHAIAEADRLDLELGFNIQSGWNLGGPAVRVEESSKMVAFSKANTTGGQTIDLVLPAPPAKHGFYRDFAVLAVPLAPAATASARQHASSSQTGHGPELAADGSTDTFWVSGTDQPGTGPAPQRPQYLAWRFDQPERADRVEIHPRPGYGPKQGHIEIHGANGSEILAKFTMEDGKPGVVSFSPAEAKEFRVVFTDAWDARETTPRNVQVAEVSLFSGTRLLAGNLPQAPAKRGIRDLKQKAYFAYPGAFTATEAWHLLADDPPSPDDPLVPVESVVDLTDKMEASGRLRWDAPPGLWEILRFGYTASGAHVSTHSENAGGHAIDYLDRTTLEAYWSRTLDPIFQDVRPYLGKSLRFLHTDSWELGPVNWTPRMPEEFAQRRGYAIQPYLPVLAGHIIGSRDTTTRFLNDFRRTLADLMADNKYKGFAEKAHALGVGIHPESGGPHAGPMDALRNLGISDVPMGEFWSTSPRHRVEDFQRFFVKQTTSAAHVYGRRVSLAEAFTNIGRHWQHDPRSLKATFDRAACEGHNLTMWHTFPSSPPAQGLPGAAYFAGEHLNPNVTWWPQAHAFISYLNRCHFLLQQGLAANDVLHFYGENVPSFVRLKRDDPARCLPGYDYDVTDMRALLERVRADESGNLVLPEGTRYRLLSLVAHNAISLPTLRHIAGLVEAGATLVGPRPSRPFSLGGGPDAEKEFLDLAARLWGEESSQPNRYGKGRVFSRLSSREVLQADGIPEDFSWSGGDNGTFIDFIHRRTNDAHIYFVANRNPRNEQVRLRFRVTGLVPELWDPVTGNRRTATDYRVENGVTEIPYPLHGEESLFVVFRTPADKAAPPAGTPYVVEPAVLAQVDGPWEVSFDPAWGGPEKITFDTLADWTNHSDDGIRYYSGAATYSKSFGPPPASGRVFLDLGMVESLCEVTLNGENLGVLWSAPFRVELTGRLKPGANTLQIKVVNLWCNRVIGDAKLPEEKRRTRTNITRLNANTPLEPSGLLGPVRLLHSPDSR